MNDLKGVLRKTNLGLFPTKDMQTAPVLIRFLLRMRNVLNRMKKDDEKNSPIFIFRVMKNSSKIRVKMSRK